MSPFGKISVNGQIWSRTLHAYHELTIKNSSIQIDYFSINQLDARKIMNLAQFLTILNCKYSPIQMFLVFEKVYTLNVFNVWRTNIFFALNIIFEIQISKIFDHRKSLLYDERQTEINVRSSGTKWSINLLW